VQRRLGSLADTAPAIEGPIHHTFLVAGGALPDEVDGLPLELTREALQRTIEDNLVAAIDGIQIARRAWIWSRERPQGSITLVSSINALAPFGLPVYSACKAALTGLTVALSGTLACEGMRLNCVALGTVRHARVEGLHARQAQHFERLAAATPTGRLMIADEAAGALIHVGLDMTTTVGQVIVVDGGQLATEQPSL
jgi:NAD(P)-dependent dehydrogenase (short-subunit alcohol dehydrogenase family)